MVHVETLLENCFPRNSSSDYSIRGRWIVVQTIWMQNSEVLETDVFRK